MARLAASVLHLFSSRSHRHRPLRTSIADISLHFMIGTCSACTPHSRHDSSLPGNILHRSLAIEKPITDGHSPVSGSPLISCTTRSGSLNLWKNKQSRFQSHVSWYPFYLDYSSSLLSLSIPPTHDERPKPPSSHLPRYIADAVAPVSIAIDSARSNANTSLSLRCRRLRPRHSCRHRFHLLIHYAQSNMKTVAHPTSHLIQMASFVF